MKAIIFDMDGTLVDSMGMWQQCTMDFFRHFKMDQRGFDFDTLNSIGLGESIQLMGSRYGIAVEDGEVDQLISQPMLEFYCSDCQLRPGILQTLDELGERGIPLYVGTATELSMARQALRHLDIESRFRLIYSRTVDQLPKNDFRFYERMIQLISQDLGRKIQGSEIAFFDDGLYGLVAAQRLGLYTIGVEDRSHPQDEEAMRRNTDDYIESFADFSAGAWADQLGFE